MTDKTVSRHHGRGGLNEEEVARSRAQHGDNVLTPPKKVSLWKLYAEKYDDPIIRIILIAAASSLFLASFSGNYMETTGIFVAIFLATTIGFYFERDAAKKFNILTSLSEESPVKVRRGGSIHLIKRCDVVVGDIVLIETGDEVPADGKLIEAASLQIDESSLTGEPIAYKRVAHDDAFPAESGKHPGSAYPEDMLLRGTMVMNGRGEICVTAVGDNTEIGKVARNSTEPTRVKTPLNMQLEKLAELISKWGVGVSVAAAMIFLVHSIMIEEVWRTDNYIGMAEVALNYFMMAVTLIVMSVPEGLPMAVTLSLALNMRRMLNNNNLVRKLHACETMGAVTVICTDKTGTLTQNRMEVADMLTVDGTFLNEAIALNTTAFIDDEGKGIGNPTEAALLQWLRRNGVDYEAVRESAETSWQLPFSTERKLMATVACVKTDAAGKSLKRILFVKGAPEIILSLCGKSTDEGDDLCRKLREYQDKAMRTLAFAAAEWDDGTMGANATAYREALSRRGDKDLHSRQAVFSLQAIAAISDPVRKDVPQSVAMCRKAGIEVKIVTGDNSATAAEIAREIGITGNGTDASDPKTFMTGADFAAMSDDEAYEAAASLKVMSRARPTDKQRLVQMLQRRGEVVAVTGDGTNDAPALHYAHVGLSLGSGTAVAKEASDMTLLDDSFRSIVHAVMWGRSLYINIQRFLFFQLTVNVTALLLVLGGSLAGTQMPLTVTQILWVNLIMDTFAAMALASLPPSEEVMNQKPRGRNDSIITPGMWRGILFTGISQFVVMFAMLIYCLHAEPGIQLHELSLFFTTFVMLQAWNLLNAKCLHTDRSAFEGVTKEHGMHIVLLMIIAGQWLIVTFGGKMFRTTPLSASEWAFAIAATSVILWAGEGWRLAKRMKKTWKQRT